MANFINKMRNGLDMAIIPFQKAQHATASAAHRAKTSVDHAQSRVSRVATAIKDEYASADNALSKGVFYAKLISIPLVGGASSSMMGLANSTFLLRGLETLRHTYDMTLVVKNKLAESTEGLGVFVNGYVQDHPNLNPVVRSGLKCAVMTTSLSGRALGFTCRTTLNLAKAAIVRVIPTNLMSSSLMDKRVIATGVVAAVMLAPTVYFGFKITSMAVKGIGIFSITSQGLKYADGIRNSKQLKALESFATDKVIGRELTGKEKEIATACAIIALSALVYYGGSKAAQCLNDATKGFSPYAITAVNVGAYTYIKFRSVEVMFCEEELSETRLMTQSYDQLQQEKQAELDLITTAEEAIALHKELQGHLATFKQRTEALEKDSSLEHMSATISFRRFKLLVDRAQIKAGELVSTECQQAISQKFTALEATREGVAEGEFRVERTANEIAKFERLERLAVELKEAPRLEITNAIKQLKAILKLNDLEHQLVEIQTRLATERDIRALKRNKSELKYFLGKLKSFSRSIERHKDQLDLAKRNFPYMDRRAAPAALVEGAAEFFGAREHVAAEHIHSYFADRVGDLVAKLDKAELAVGEEVLPILTMMSICYGVPLDLLLSVLTENTNKAEEKAQRKEALRALRAETKAKSRRDQTAVRAPQTRYNLRARGGKSHR